MIRSILPPIIFDLAARLRGSGWSGDYQTWQAARADSTGYDDRAILARVEAAALKVKSGEAAYERDSVLFDEIHYSWALLSGLMWVAARNQGRLDVLDFGGGLGSSYYQNRRFLSALDVRWNVVEQPGFVESGRRNFADERLKFHPAIDDCPTANVAVLSSVLQYLERPYELLAQLRTPVVVIDLTLVHAGDRDRITVQEVPPDIYPARYPCWVFSEPKFRESLKRDFEIVAEFDSHIGHDIRIGPIRAGYRGFILERKK